MENGQLRVWWIPQVPMKPFNVLVNNLEEANLLLNALADYDIFQYENNVKADYCNMGGLSIWDEDIDEDDLGEKWRDWYDEEEDMDFDEYRETLLKRDEN